MKYWFFDNGEWAEINQFTLETLALEATIDKGETRRYSPVSDIRRIQVLPDKTVRTIHADRIVTSENKPIEKPASFRGS